MNCGSFRQSCHSARTVHADGVGAGVAAIDGNDQSSIRIGVNEFELVAARHREP